MTELGVAAKVRAAFELSPSILSVTGLDDGRIIEVNDAFVRVIGYPREELIGRPVADLAIWVDHGQREAGIERLRAGGSIRDLEARFRTKAGEEIVTLASADVITIDGRRCIMTALVDITARVRAEAALRESEQRFAHLFDANPVPMTIVRVRDGRHLAINEAALRTSGYTREEVMGRTTFELGLWSDTDQRARLVELLGRDGRVRDYEMLARSKSGEVRQMLINADVITYGGEPAVLNVVLDITERTELEAQREARREEAEAQTRAKDEFLAMLGHELRNPLGTITNTLDVLRQGATGDELRRLTAIIHRQASHLTRLVDDLLDVARVTSGKTELRREIVDVRDVARRCADALTDAGRTDGHHILLEGEGVKVFADPARLAQVVGNLLDNALKYTPPGGEVRIITAREGSTAVLRVRDTGEGMRPELLERIFDLFVQESQALDRARGGLGLGLTLVKRLVELHDGSVEAASAGPGRGSEFTVRLPAAAEAPARAGAPRPPASPATRRRRILIVEDNADSRESLRLLLARRGHEVDEAEDGVAALEKIESFQPEIALVDVGLPGMDGYELARRVRASKRAGPRLIAVTGYGQSEDRRKALEAGFDFHVTKPVDPDRLQHLFAED